MDQVPIRQLNQDTAGVLARVEGGETVEITNRGKPIARLVPVPVDPLEELIRAGMVVPPTLSGPVPRPAGEVSPDLVESGELVTSMRDDERW